MLPDWFNNDMQSYGIISGWLGTAGWVAYLLWGKFRLGEKLAGLRPIFRQMIPSKPLIFLGLWSAFAAGLWIALPTPPSKLSIVVACLGTSLLVTFYVLEVVVNVLMATGPKRLLDALDALDAKAIANPVQLPGDADSQRMDQQDHAKDRGVPAPRLANVVSRVDQTSEAREGKA